MTNHDLWFPAEPESDPKWERLEKLKTLTPEQMEGMLAFLSGSSGDMWDEAYRRNSGDVYDAG